MMVVMGDASNRATLVARAIATSVTSAISKRFNGTKYSTVLNRVIVVTETAQSEKTTTDGLAPRNYEASLSSGISQYTDRVIH